MSGDAYHLTAPSEDGNGAFRSMRNALQKRPPVARQHRLHQRSRHLDPARRRDRAGRRQAPVRRPRLQALDVVDQIGDRSSARRRRQRRGDILDPGVARRGGAADPQPRKPVAVLRHRPRAETAAEAPGQVRAVEFVRVRWHQCLADFWRGWIEGDEPGQSRAPRNRSGERLRARGAVHVQISPRGWRGACSARF